jgi:hypothetical protein
MNILYVTLIARVIVVKYVSVFADIVYVAGLRIAGSRNTLWDYGQVSI